MGNIERRTIEIAEYMIESRKTIRDIAKEFRVSKSVVHRDLTIRLPKINRYLASKVKEVLEYHKSVRHIRANVASHKKPDAPTSDH